MTISQITINRILASHKIEKQNTYLMVFDGLWYMLEQNSTIVNKLDILTRRNQYLNIVQIVVTHGLSDITMINNKRDQILARSFISRIGMIAIFSASPGEIEDLSEYMKFSSREEDILLSSWRNPILPSGRGSFMIKSGSREGLVCNLILTDKQKELHNTDKKIDCY